MDGFAFEIGDFVRLKHTNEMRLHIIERAMQQCPGGVQFHYKGRVFVAKRSGLLRRSEEPPEWHSVPQLEVFNEVELEHIAKPAPPPSKENA